MAWHTWTEDKPQAASIYSSAYRKFGKCDQRKYTRISKLLSFHGNTSVLPVFVETVTPYARSLILPIETYDIIISITVRLLILSRRAQFEVRMSPEVPTGSMLRIRTSDSSFRVLQWFQVSVFCSGFKFLCFAVVSSFCVLQWFQVSGFCSGFLRTANVHVLPLHAVVYMQYIAAVSVHAVHCCSVFLALTGMSVTVFVDRVRDCV